MSGCIGGIDHTHLDSERAVVVVQGLPYIDWVQFEEIVDTIERHTAINA